MKPETRQTLIGVCGIVAVEIVAIHEGFNGAVFASSMVSIVALVAPEALDKLPWSGSGG